MQQTYKPAGSLVMQTSSHIRQQIDRGHFRVHDKLLSVNAYSKQYGVARDTIEKAYNILKREGYIKALSGKGYYVVGKPDSKIKVLLLFNKLSAYKKMIYDSLMAELKGKAAVDLCIHHYDPFLLEELLHKHLGNYHYYVVMPHFFEDCDRETYLELLQRIPSDQLILLDKDVPELPRHSSVCQDFKQDIQDALFSLNEVLAKYKELVLIFPDGTHHPEEIKSGIRAYTKSRKKQFRLSISMTGVTLTEGRVYILLKEHDLAEAIKMARKSHLILGQDIGIISFNETIFKELLDITVISTDFEAMGKATAEHILTNTQRELRNPFKVIIRSSV